LTRQYLWFESYCIDPKRRLLIKDGTPLPVTGKEFETLLVLVENAGRVLDKEEILQKVWPQAIVEENNLTQHISHLRRLLGESRSSHKFIVTHPGIGYQFVADVRRTTEEAVPAHQPLPSEEIAPGSVTRIPSIAVMKLQAAAEAGEIDHLCAGLSETLSHCLSQTMRLEVRLHLIERLDEHLPTQAIGRRLGVDYLLKGSIRKSGERVRISLQLLRTTDSSVTWSGKFDEPLQDLFSIEDSVSEQVAAALKVELARPDTAGSMIRRPSNWEAYDAYLRGRYFWNQRTAASLRRGIACFEEAISKDPLYAPAQAGMADSYSQLGVLPYLPPGEAFPRALAAAQQALEIDPTLADAHASRSIVRMIYEWDWRGAQEGFEHALELDPSCQTARLWYGDLMLALGDGSAALKQLRLALDRDPVSRTVNRTLGRALLFEREFDRAIDQFRRTLELDPNFPRLHALIALAYLRKAMPESALPELLQEQSLHSTPWSLAALGHAWGEIGEEGKARAILRQLDVLSRSTFVSPCHRAIVYAGMGWRDDAFSWLEKACGERNAWLIFLRSDPYLESLRPDPRFDLLVGRIWGTDR